MPPKTAQAWAAPNNASTKTNIIYAIRPATILSSIWLKPGLDDVHSAPIFVNLKILWPIAHDAKVNISISSKFQTTFRVTKTALRHAEASVKYSCISAGNISINELELLAMESFCKMIVISPDASAPSGNSPHD